MRDYVKLLDWLRSSQNACYIYGCDECPADCENHEGDIFKDAADAIEELLKRPVIPETGIGDLSDGYHTFNSLYYQRMILFASLVRTYKDRSWKSFRHEDGELCFGGGWFIVGIDTPEGSYTYHYENKDFDRFDCVELPRGKHWDGHAEDDVVRLLSLPAPTKWISVEERLPGKDDMVFVYYEWTGQSGTVYKEVSLSTLGEIQHFGFKPIAWMPLPDPPKEDA